MNWSRRPRIHTHVEPHQWVIQGGRTDELIAAGEWVITCDRCGARPRTRNLDQFLAARKYGCAGHRFRGRYRPGDHVDWDNMRYIFRDRHGTEALIEEMGARRSITVPVAELEPVLAGRAEAEKRRQAHVAELIAEGKLDA